MVEATLKNDKDIISIAATGSGKTLIWMPLLFKKDEIQIIITSLNILGKQNVKSLKAMSITVTAGNATKQTFKVTLTCYDAAKFGSPSYCSGNREPEISGCGDEY